MDPAGDFEVATAEKWREPTWQTQDCWAVLLTRSRLAMYKHSIDLCGCEIVFSSTYSPEGDSEKAEVGFFQGWSGARQDNCTER